MKGQFLFDLPLPAGWRLLSVDDIKSPEKHSCVAGPFGSSISSKFFVEQGVPVIRGGNLRDDLTPFVAEGFVFVSPEQAQRYKGQHVRGGDLVFTCWGTLGQVGLIPKDGPFPEYIISNKQLKLRPNGEIADARFLFYYFGSPQMVQHIRNIAIGAAVPGINLGLLKALQVALPPLEVQEDIVRFLSAYDDLIENNIRRIKVLKEIARTVFDCAARQGTDEWKIVPIREVYSGFFDGPHATPKPSAEGPIFLGIKNVTEQGELDLSEVRHIAEDDFSQWTRRVFPRFGDIVFSYEATLNRYAIINRGFRGCLGRRLALIRPDQEKIDPFVLLRCLLSDDWRREVQSKVISGATVDRIPLIGFPNFSIRIPNRELQAKIGPTIRSCEELAENCRRRNDMLRTTRDLLLPKLISGEIPVEVANDAGAELMEEIAQPA